MTWPLSSAHERMVRQRIDGLRGDDLAAAKKQLLNISFRLRMTFIDRVVGTTIVRHDSLQNDDANAWALGRHFGLITPFLDWSDSSYVALFFAIADLCEHNRDDGRRIRLSSSDQIALFRLEHRLDLTSSGLRIERPRFDGQGRLSAQRGAFTWLSGDAGFLSLEEYLASRGQLHYLKKFVLVGRAIKDAYEDLRANGIDYRHVYPDEHGAALAANQTVDELLFT